MTYSPLQWLAPDMAREGLIRNNPWVEPACEAAVAMFSDRKMAVAATVIAALHPFAIEYIRQAPALVVALAQGRDLAARKERLRVANQIALLCSRGPRLKNLMRGCGLQPQLRGLLAPVLRLQDWDLLRKLSAVPPSTLAQSIPATARQQRLWLCLLDTWTRHMGRQFDDPGLHLGWAAIRLRDVPMRMNAANAPAPALDVRDLADFAGNSRRTFNEKWTLQQAVNASERWHVESARQANEAAFLHQHGIGWKQIIDYAPLPARAEIGGFEFVALQSGAQIFSEGREMHHCVMTYAALVARGRSRLYSIRQQGSRVATLELVRMSSTTRPRANYAPAQLKGPGNGAVSEQIAYAARAFVNVVNNRLDENSTVNTRQASPDQSSDAALNQARQCIVRLLQAHGMDVEGHP